MELETEQATKPIQHTLPRRTWRKPRFCLIVGLEILIRLLGRVEPPKVRNIRMKRTIQTYAKKFNHHSLHLGMYALNIPYPL